MVQIIVSCRSPPYVMPPAHICYRLVRLWASTATVHCCTCITLLTHMAHMKQWVMG